MALFGAKRTWARGGGTEIPQCTFGRLLVNSGLSLAIVPRDDRERRQRKGHRQPGLEGDQATALVFCGDTLYAESEVLEKRESKLRPTQPCILASDGIRSQRIDLEAGPRRGRQALKNGIH
jgi:acyl dehydratase